MESLPKLRFLGCEMLLLANNRELSLSHHLLRYWDWRLIKAKIVQICEILLGKKEACPMQDRVQFGTIQICHLHTWFIQSQRTAIDIASKAFLNESFCVVGIFKHIIVL